MKSCRIKVGEQMLLVGAAVSACSGLLKKDHRWVLAMVQWLAAG